MPTMCSIKGAGGVRHLKGDDINVHRNIYLLHEHIMYLVCMLNIELNGHYSVHAYVLTWQKSIFYGS